MDMMTVVGLLMIGFAALGVYGGAWMIWRIFKYPRALFWQVVTAVSWTLITLFGGLIQTAVAILSDASIIGSVYVILSGWFTRSCWRQLEERRQGDTLTQKRRFIISRIWVQSLWGPLVLSVITIIATVQGQQYFMDAVARRDVTTALFLQEYGIGATNYEEIKADFAKAVEAEDVAGVSAYLTVGTAPWYGSKDLLPEAAATNNSVVTELFLRYGHSPNAQYWAGGSTPLHRAAGHGKVNQVRVLLRYGADRNARNSYGRTPLQVARERGYKEVFALLTSPEEQRSPTKNRIANKKRY